MEKNENQSKNQRAEEIFGLRPHGMAIQFPWELDYACPICTPPITKETEIFDANGQIKPEYERLRYSEYQGFMWCSHCNLDIPSFLCLSPKDIEAVHIYTERFLDFGKDFTTRLYQDLSNEEIQLQSFRIKRLDLLEKIKRLEFEKRRLEEAMKFVKYSLINRMLLRFYEFRKKMKK